LKYVTKYGKEAFSFVGHVPARDVKSALSLVVCLFWEHSKVPAEKSIVEDLLMKLIKKSSKDETIQSNLIGRVNDSFAKFVVDFLSMLLLVDSFIYHNAQAAPAPWADRKLSIQEQSLLQQNQIVLLKFCLCQSEDVTWKFCSNRKSGQLGLPVTEIDSL
jgi:hypothetical protein